MLNMFKIVVSFFIIFLACNSQYDEYNTTFYKKIQMHWLSNGGSIISWFTDNIIMEVHTTPLPKGIKCPCRSNYAYKPGTTKRFNDLWFPAEEVFSISLRQLGVFFDDGVNLQAEDFNQPGFYVANLTI